MRQDLIVLRALSFILFMLFIMIGREWATNNNDIQNLSTYNKTVNLSSISEFHNFIYK